MANVAWSYSRLKSFEDCPKKFYHLNIARDVKEQPSEAMTAGANDHKHLESRIREGKPLPSHLASMEPVCAAFGAARERGMELLTEQQWAFTRDFQPTDWFSKSVWVRVILDVAAVSKKNALVADWKTGRRDPDCRTVSAVPRRKSHGAVYLDQEWRGRQRGVSPRRCTGNLGTLHRAGRTASARRRHEHLAGAAEPMVWP